MQITVITILSVSNKARASCATGNPRSMPPTPRENHRWSNKGKEDSIGRGNIHHIFPSKGKESNRTCTSEACITFANTYPFPDLFVGDSKE